jgi:RNA polymerase sigma-70 factor (ECF subfamily)
MLATHREMVVSEHAEWSTEYVSLWPSVVRAVAACAGTFEGVEDAVQDAFIESLPRRDEIQGLEGWLFVVALRRLRATRRRDALRRLLVRSRRETSPDELEQALERIDLVRALRRLPELERVLIVAKYYVGMTQDEIASRLRIRRGTVSAKLSRAVARVRASEEEVRRERTQR